MKPHIHEDLMPRLEARASSDRQFGLIVGGVAVAIALSPLVRHRPIRLWVLAAGAALVVIGLVAPVLLRPLNRAWTWLGRLIGRVMNPVAMAVLFYGVFTPLALLLRILGKDSLRLRRDAGTASYWIEREPPGPEPETMANQF